MPEPRPHSGRRGSGDLGRDDYILLAPVMACIASRPRAESPARIVGGPETGGSTWTGYSWPFFLPRQDALLYTAMQGGNLGEGALMFQTLAGPAPTRLRANRTRAHYTPDGLLLARLIGPEGLGRASLTVHRFDPSRPTIEEPGVELSSDASLNFGASDTGVIVYLPARANADYRFEWVDDSGRPAGDGFATVGSTRSVYRVTNICWHSLRAATSSCATCAWCDYAPGRRPRRTRAHSVS